MDTRDRFQTAVKKAFKSLLRECSQTNVTAEQVNARLFSSVVEDVLLSFKKGGTLPKAEATAAELVRLGVSKKAMDTCFLRISVLLANATFILHKCQYPPGTVEVLWAKRRCVLRSGLPSKDLARAIIDLDALLPELLPKEKELQDLLGVERKAMQVQRVTVKSQLEAVIPETGLECRYEVKDGLVHLYLTRRLEGRVSVPVSQLPGFLADPRRLDAALTPANDACVDEIQRFVP